MQVDVQLSQSVMEAARRAPELQALGVDGVFSFENSHDLFFPLVAAALVCDLDLMTNVAYADRFAAAAASARTAGRGLWSACGER